MQVAGHKHSNSLEICMLVGLDLIDCTNIMTEKQIFIRNKNNFKSAHPESFYKHTAECRHMEGTLKKPSGKGLPSPAA